MEVDHSDRDNPIAHLLDRGASLFGSDRDAPSMLWQVTHYQHCTPAGRLVDGEKTPINYGYC
jgi:hypothetical protein